MDKSKHIIGAGEFKAKCLQLMDEVDRLHHELIITKHGKPIAKLVPFEENALPLYGYMQSSIQIVGDVVESLDETWEADE